MKAGKRGTHNSYDLTNCSEILKNRHLLFDTDAIISIVSFNSTAAMDELAQAHVANCIINPVKVELIRNSRGKEGSKRAAFLSAYSFINLMPMMNIKSVEDHVGRIQQWMFRNDCDPSVTDLYLAAVLASYRNESLFLLTANLKDFPLPLFTRRSRIILESKKNLKVLSVLSFNHEALENILGP